VVEEVEAEEEEEEEEEEQEEEHLVFPSSNYPRLLEIVVVYLP
jgi:hypothetical protein